MKKFLINITIFFAVVAAVDFSLGKLFHYLQSTAGGRTGAEYYACKESNEDVIIMGSSRASHHYVPKIITEKTGMSCFNAGQDGNGIILQYGRWKMISERYSPKLIIYDVTPGFDLFENDNMTYVDRLKPFCDHNQVKNYIVGLYPSEKLKLFSKMYRFNYKFIEMIFDCAQNENDEKKGYLPLYGLIKDEVIASSYNAHNTYIKPIDYDEIKLHYLDALTRECISKGTKIVFVASPIFIRSGYNNDTFSAVRSIADNYGVQFLFYYVSDYSDNPQNFKDSYHLNDEGANSFTREIVSKIQI